MMVFLNTLWTLTGPVCIPRLGLSEADFSVKLMVSGVLAIGLARSGRRAGVI